MTTLVSTTVLAQATTCIPSTSLAHATTCIPSTTPGWICNLAAVVCEHSGYAIVDSIGVKIINLEKSTETELFMLKI